MTFLKVASFEEQNLLPTAPPSFHHIQSTYFHSHVLWLFSCCCCLSVFLLKDNPSSYALDLILFHYLWYSLYFQYYQVFLFQNIFIIIKCAVWVPIKIPSWPPNPSPATICTYLSIPSILSWIHTNLYH